MHSSCSPLALGPSCCLSSPLYSRKKKKKTLSTNSPQLFPESKQIERRREKEERGGASEMKCVLKMAEFPLAAELHSHVFRGEQTGGVRESKMAARLHIIRLFSLDPTTSHLKKSDCHSMRVEPLQKFRNQYVVNMKSSAQLMNGSRCDSFKLSKIKIKTVQT